MWLEIGTLVTAVFTAVAAMAALWTVRESQKAIKNTAMAVEAELLTRFSKEYSSQSMLSALHILRNWKENYKDKFADKFEELYKSKNEDALKVNRARRMYPPISRSWSNTALL